MKAVTQVAIGMLLVSAIGCGPTPAPKKKVGPAKPAATAKRSPAFKAPTFDNRPTPFPIGDQQQDFSTPLNLNPMPAEVAAQPHLVDPLSFAGDQHFFILQLAGTTLAESPLLGAMIPRADESDDADGASISAQLQQWEAIWLYLGAPAEGDRPPGVLRYTVFRAREQLQAKLAELRNPDKPQQAVEKATLGERQYERFTDQFGESQAFFALGERDLLDGSERLVQAALQAMDKPSPSGRLAELMRPELGKAPVVAAFAPGEHRALAQAMADEMSEDLGMPVLSVVARVADRATLLLTPGGPELGKLHVQALDEQGANEVRAAAESLKQDSAPAGTEPSAAPFAALTHRLLANVTAGVAGKDVDVVIRSAPVPNTVAGQPPAPSPPGETRRITPEELREWVLRAWVSPSELPRDIVSKDGKPLLSWRVAILPYGEQEPLFREFHHDEPWDSMHNMAILTEGAGAAIAKYLKTDYGEGNTTTWKMVPGWLNGIVLVEGGPGSEVPWTKPDMVPLDPENPLAQFGKEPPSGYRVAMYDGKIERLDAATLAQRLKPPMIHNSLIAALAIEREGKLLATAGGKNDILIWDLTREKNIATLTGHADAVLTLDFSPDGKTLASGSRDKTIKLWNVADWTLKSTLEGHTSDVHSVKFHSGGKGLASGSYDSTIRLWSLGTGRSTATYDVKVGGIFALSFSPDGRALASAGAGDDHVLVWNIANGQKVADLPGHEASVLTVAFSPDGKKLASGDYGGAIKVWDVAKGTATTLPGHKLAVNNLVFDKSGDRLITASSDRTVRVWDLATGEPATSFQDSESVAAVVLHPDGDRVISGGNSTKINTWNLGNKPAR